MNLPLLNDHAQCPDYEGIPIPLPHPTAIHCVWGKLSWYTHLVVLVT